MAGDYPEVGVNGEVVTVRNREDVRKAFTGHSGFEEGQQVEEYTVDQMDCELDYNNREEKDILRVHLYLEPVTNDVGAFIGDEDLEVEGWERVSYVTDDDLFGIVYEVEDWVFL